MRMGKNILILATAGSTVEPTRRKLEREALLLGQDVSLNKKVCAKAFEALKAGNAELHDHLLREEAKTIRDVDCIVLAQASMAHLREEMEKSIGIPLLASPDLCIDEILEHLEN